MRLVSCIQITLIVCLMAVVNATCGKAYGQTRYYPTEAMNPLLFGLSFFGSGGGGGLGDGNYLVEQIVKAQPEGFTIYDVSSASDDATLVVAGGIGSPDALSQKIPELEVAINKAVELTSQVKPTSLLSVETGPVNSLLSVLINLNNENRIYDLDGAGRSVPSLTNLSYAHQNVYPISPISLAAAPSDASKPPPAVHTFTNVKDAGEAETQIRQLISQNPQFGQLAGLALWKQTGQQLKSSPYVVSGTFDKSFQVGTVLFNSRNNLSELVQYLIPVMESLRLPVISYGKGVLRDVTSQTKGGFDLGIVTVELESEGLPIQLKIYNKNENLVSILAFPSNAEDGAVELNSLLISAPTVMSYLINPPGSSSYIPLNNGDDLKQLIGQEIVVIWSTPDILLYDNSLGWLDSFRQQIDTLQLPFRPQICPNPTNQEDPWYGCMLSDSNDNTLAWFVEQEFSDYYSDINTTYQNSNKGIDLATLPKVIRDALEKRWTIDE